MTKLPVVIERGSPPHRALQLLGALAALGFFLIVLYFRPQGLFGSKRVERV